MTEGHQPVGLVGIVLRVQLGLDGLVPGDLLAEQLPIAAQVIDVRSGGCVAAEEQLQEQLATARLMGLDRAGEPLAEFLPS